MVRVMSTLVFVFLAFQAGQGRVIINEVMVNEPGSYQSLEWIELYADSSETATLDSYRLTIDGNEVALPFGLSVAPGGYLIICRRLTSSESGSFESHWGDGSGVWGDSDYEAAIGEPIEAAFSLKNSGGSMTLWRRDNPVSTFSWDDGGGDGVSFERLAPDSLAFVPCIARAGSTPGSLNSVTPAANDLAITSVEATADDPLTELTITVANRGINDCDAVWLCLYSVDDTRLLDSISVAPLTEGDSLVLERQYTFTSLRIRLAAAIPADDRTDNDSLQFWAPGNGYPPVILSEIMPAPADEARGEWVELLSVHDHEIDLSGWKLGDSRKLCDISHDPLFLSPGERIVLAWDRAAFLAHHDYVPVHFAELERWAQLNNGSDTVRLVDPYGLEADVFGYDEAPDAGYTLGRRDGDRESIWGESVESGGTPGEPNRVLVAGQSPSLTMTISPKVFSPDGDGIDDTTLIHIDAPTLGRVKLELYDRTGRRIFDFEADRVKANDYVWRGTDNGGAPLPIGIYIVYCQVDGQAAKQAVVIARQ